MLALRVAVLPVYEAAMVIQRNTKLPAQLSR